jgi:sigma-B regulation protein RsbU (phosphoserine phosphatase)
MSPQLATIPTSSTEVLVPPSQDSLALLHEVSRELASILDREKLLLRVAELVKGLIDYQLFGVMLWDEETQHLEAAISARWNGCRTHKQSVRLGEGLCGTAAVLRRPVRVGDVSKDSRFLDCGDSQVRSELVVPMLVEDRLIGVLDLESYLENAFSPEAEQLMGTLAANLAVALENARLYEKVKADEQRLQQELSAARQMQRLLLPKSTPWSPGIQTAVAYCPARHLGGDFYDFLPFGDHRTAFVVADVAGKGSGAALYGAMAIGMLRGYVAENHCQPDCQLAYINEELASMRVEKRFLATTFAVYDRRDHSFVISNAGLPYPYLLHAGEVEEIPVSGLPLGALAAAEYKNATLTLAPGDAVIFASDGIEEARSAGGEAFGETRTRETLQRLAHLPATEIADGLMAASDEHMVGVPEPSDDRTVVVVKRSLEED